MKWGGFVFDVVGFDVEFFGIILWEVVVMDLQQ